MRRSNLSDMEFGLEFASQVQIIDYEGIAGGAAGKVASRVAAPTGGSKPQDLRAVQRSLRDRRGEAA